MRDLKGKRAVITGAGSGIGRALALELARLGAVPILLDKNVEGLAETASLLGHPSEVGRYEVDVRDFAAVAAAACAIDTAYGGLDILINNAGVISRAESFLQVDEAHAKFVFDVNYWGVDHGCRAFAPLLARAPEAALVNVASSMGVVSCPLHAHYCASKAAVAAYTATLRQELSSSGVTVTVVLPGASKTALGRNIEHADPVERAQAAANFERFAITTPEAVARKIVAAIRSKRTTVATGVDGAMLVWLGRHFGGLAHAAMNYAYRRSATSEQFAGINSVFKPRLAR